MQGNLLSKTVTVYYYSFQTVKPSAMTDLKYSFDSLLKSEKPYGCFEAEGLHFRILENVSKDINVEGFYIISLLKEKHLLPAIFNIDSGEVENVEIEENKRYGDLFYMLINPEKGLALALPVNSGSAKRQLKDFLYNILATDEIVFEDIFMEGIDETVLNWNFFKKISASIKFPTFDDVAEFSTTKEGALMPILDAMAGKRIDITIISPPKSEPLASDNLKNITKALLPNDFCNKLSIKGTFIENLEDSSNEEGYNKTFTTEEYNLKHAPLKHKELITVEAKTIIPYIDAKAILIRALNEEKDYLLGVSEG